MIQDKIFLDEKDPTGLSYNTPFTVYGSYQGRLWSKTPSGSIQYYSQNSDLSAYATTGSNQFNGSQTITGSLTVTGGISGSSAESASYSLNADKIDNLDSTQLVLTSSFNSYTSSASSSVGSLSSSVATTTSGLGGRITTIEGNYATTGSNIFVGSQVITGSICSNGNIVTTGQIVAQTINVQQVTSSIVYSCGSNIFGTDINNTQTFTGSMFITGSNIRANVGNTCFQGSVCASTFALANGNCITALRSTGGAPIGVLGITSGTDTLFIKGGTSGASEAIQFQDTGGTIATFFNSRLGIGCTAPNYHLEVRCAASTSSCYLAAMFARTTGAADGVGDVVAFGANGVSSIAGIFRTVGSWGLELQTANQNTRMRIDNGGNIGIGTLTPGTKLEISSTAADADRTLPHNVLTITALQTQAPYGPFGGSILFKNSSYVSGVVCSARIRSVIYDDGAPANCGGGLWFETTPTPGGTLTPSLVIDYQGRVGIRCSSPGAQLVVYGACNGDTTLHVQNGSVSGKITFSNNTANAIYGGGWYGYMGYNSATYHYFGQCIVAPNLRVQSAFADLTLCGTNTSSPHLGGTFSITTNQDGNGRTIIGNNTVGRAMYLEANGNVTFNCTLSAPNLLTTGANASVRGGEGALFRGSSVTQIGNNITFDAFRFLNPTGGVGGAASSMSGILYMSFSDTVTGGNQVSYQYLIFTTGNGVSPGPYTFTQLYAGPVRGTNPISSITLVNDGSGGAVKVQATTAASGVGGATAYITFVGNAV